MKLLLFLLFWWSFLTHDPTPLQVKLLGQSDPQLEEAAYFYARELGMDHVNIVIAMSLHLPPSVNGYLLYEEVAQTGQRNAVIRIRATLTAAEKARVLAHEMIHLRQYLDQRLVQISPHRFAWEGKAYEWRHLPYQQRGWEKEALDQESELLKRFQTNQKAVLAAR